MKHLHSLAQLTTWAVMVFFLNGCSALSPTATPYPTQTPYSTATPYPTSTPRPTETATATPTSTPTPSNIVELYDFENQATPVPSGMAADRGTLIADALSEVWNKYEIDAFVFHSGTKSLKFTSDINTTRWYKIARQIPTNYDQVFVSYYAKGNNLRKEGKQFDTCYVGFMLTDSSGKNEWPGNEYGGTFDWRYGEQRLSSSQMRSLRESGSKIEFRIACFKSGEFWIDDLRFEFSPLGSSTTPTSVPGLNKP